MLGPPDPNDHIRRTEQPNYEVLHEVLRVSCPRIAEDRMSVDACACAAIPSASLVVWRARPLPQCTSVS